ncbi:MAG TPA: hypothetical protein PLL77_07200 [Pyrinomonadaceae bacterium]|nr:hypothetical protein [Pyrinomonadaceae bacterium]
MDLGYLHLSLNHIPVIGSVFGFIILFIGIVARSKAVNRVGLGLLAISAIVAIPVYLTGETAEEIVEKLPGFSESITGQHESAAALSLGLAIFSGVLAITALLFSRARTEKNPGYLVIATLLLSLLTTTSMVRTANLGGQVRHTEIRSGAQNIDTRTPEKGTSEKDGDDD